MWVLNRNIFPAALQYKSGNIVNIIWSINQQFLNAVPASQHSRYYFLFIKNHALLFKFGFSLSLCFIESCWTLRLVTDVFCLRRGVIIQALTCLMQVSAFKSKSLFFIQVSEAGYLLMAILVSVISLDPYRRSYLFFFTITACSGTFTEVNIPNSK